MKRISNRFASILLIIITLFVDSCTTEKRLTYLSNLDTTSSDQFFPLDKPDYHIQFQDILYINITTLDKNMNELLNPGTFLYAQNMFRDESSIYIHGYTVSDTGTITLPILGEIHVEGLTLEDVKHKVQRRANGYLKDAVINIRLLSFKFSVIGEVSRPGSYINFNNQLTILDAIGMAGDITDYGDRRRVLVVRPTNRGTRTYRINLQDAKVLTSEGYFLLPNDVVIVEPTKSKPFQLNVPIMTLTLTTISTLILVLSFIK